MGFAVDRARWVSIHVGTVCRPCKHWRREGSITDMREDKAYSPEDSLEIRRQVQALDAASAAKRLKEEKTYEDHGRKVLNLFHGPSLRAMLTTIAGGRRTGERRGAR